MSEEKSTRSPAHSMKGAARRFEQVESVIYVLAGILLTVVAVVILGHAVYMFIDHIAKGDFGGAVITMLEELLLGLMAAELLYTVTVSLRTHSLSAEPFLIVGMVAAVRRILTISVEAAHLFAKDPDMFKLALYEIGLLTVAVLILVISIYILRKARQASPADLKPVA